MDELRALYRTLLPEHRDRLCALRTRVRGGALSGDEREAAWADILREAHTLKGSGGQFGFPEITDAALALRQAAPEARPALLDSLCQVIVDAMAGEAPAANAKPEATPQPAPSPISTTARPPATAAQAAESTTCKGRVLVVEDDPLIASVICNTLRRRGYTPTHCDLGARALTLLYDEGSAHSGPDLHESTPFDLIMLDISMPGVSGLDVLARIRREPSTADLPVMMVSAHIDASTITYARSLGADDYLTKPFAPDTLLRHVAALASARSASAASPVPASASSTALAA